MIRHIITGEFPPASGGVADYTSVLADALAAAGEEVHVWCAGRDGTTQPRAGLSVHRVLGRLGAADLANADAALAAFAGPRRLLLQWVPHAYGRGSLNVTFCRWIGRRARQHGDRLEVMVHEPFLPFGGGVKRNAAAVTHRWMLWMLLRRATRAYVPTVRWEALCRPFAARLPFSWMPIPSGIECSHPGKTVATVRGQLNLPADNLVVGSFGSGADLPSLTHIAAALHRVHPAATLLLIGAGSTDRRAALLAMVPEAAASVRATGRLSPDELSDTLRACDLCVQPYPDGVSGRRSSAMAVLAHGVPLLSTRGNATEPVWEGNPDMTAPADTLTATMLRLLAEADRRARLGREGFELYESRFHVRHTVSLLQASD